MPFSLRDYNEARNIVEELEFRYDDLSPNKVKENIRRIAILLACQ